MLSPLLEDSVFMGCYQCNVVMNPGILFTRHPHQCPDHIFKHLHVEK